MAWEQIYAERGVVQREPMTVVKKMMEILPPPDDGERLHLLDAGCGTGRHTFHAARVLPSASIFAFDASAEGVRLFERQIPPTLDGRISARVLDIDSELDLLPGPFDAIICTLVIHHGSRSQMEARFANLMRALRPNGLIAFATISDSDPRVNTGYEIEPGTRLDTAQDDGDVPHHFMSGADVDRLFNRFGPVEILHKELVRRPGATFGGAALHWEVLGRKVVSASTSPVRAEELRWT